MSSFKILKENLNTVDGNESPKWLLKKMPKIVRENCTPKIDTLEYDDGGWYCYFYIALYSRNMPEYNVIKPRTLYQTLAKSKDILNLEFMEDYDEENGDYQRISFEIFFKRG
jgi:hypothetical protein